MNRKSSFARLLLFIILGLLIGGILGESLGLLFGELGELMNAGGYDNIVRNFFVAPFESLILALAIMWILFSLTTWLNCSLDLA